MRAGPAPLTLVAFDGYFGFRTIGVSNGGLPFTPKQGKYLAFIYYYTKINGQPPAEVAMQRYFRVSAPTGTKWW